MDNTKENQPENAPSKLTQVQREIMSAIEKKDLDRFNNILNKNPKEDINFTDDDKMTPLQQAAYRGNNEMVKVLLQRGADVNKCEHTNDYTTLHFGALSGNVDVCHSLLSAGVHVNALNSINRTAAQLAGFIGYHSIVSTINNFIPKEEVIYYSQIHGTQKKPYLDPKLTENFYKFTLIYNMHPMKIAKLLNSYEGLVDNIDDVEKVLELMSEREMKKKDHNEVMVFKFFYLAYILGELSKLIKADAESKDQEEKKSFVQLFARKILKVNKQGDLECMDLMIRQGIQLYPHIESTLFRQMVASLASDQAPSALSLVSAAINGQRAFVDESNNCGTCGEEKAMKKCSKCKSVSYCDKDCQKLHWFMHKKMCGTLEAHNKKANIDSTEINADLQGILAGQSAL